MDPLQASSSTVTGLLAGDIGCRDGEGYLLITDRKRVFLLGDGINSYRREIEEVIHSFPSVTEASVIGDTGSKNGENQSCGQPLLQAKITGR